jgi:hypothetical protein
MKKVMFRLALTAYLILPAMLFTDAFHDVNESCVKWRCFVAERFRSVARGSWVANFSKSIKDDNCH